MYIDLTRLYRPKMNRYKVAMATRRNPFHPGAGSPPPEPAGRGELLERAAVALDRVRAGRDVRSVILYGLRGAGNTGRDHSRATRSGAPASGSI